MQYLIGYDICDPKRLNRIYKRMCNHATPVQYSVFLLEGNEQALNACLNEILPIFDKKEDDLRVYPLPTQAKRWHLGREILPVGIIWTVLHFIHH